MALIYQSIVGVPDIPPFLAKKRVGNLPKGVAPQFRSLRSNARSCGGAAEQAARFPDRLIAVCSLNAVSDAAAAAMRHCTTDKRFKGLKLHLGNSRVDLLNADHERRTREVFLGGRIGCVRGSGGGATPCHTPPVLFYGSDAAFGTHPDPGGSWAAFRKGIPLSATEFEKIARNIAPYVREGQ